MTATYTINDFLAGKVSIRCDNKEQQKIVLKICKENGIIWRGGKPIDNHFPREPVLTVGFFGDGRLTHGKGDHLGMNVVDFDKINLSHAPCYQIIIESDGDTTTAKMVVNGEKIATVTAKHSPVDKTDWEFWAKGVFDRLWQKQPEPEQPEQSTEKDGFKVGDRVVCVRHNHDSYGKHGRIVTILDDIDLAPFGVEFDEYVDGHDCRGAAKSGYGKWFYAIELSHEKPAKPKVRKVKRHAEIGEWVEIVDAANNFDEVYKNGDILQVVKKAYLDGAVNLSCGGFCVLPYEYVVLEGYQP